jgi:hypothetical protein
MNPCVTATKQKTVTAMCHNRSDVVVFYEFASPEIADSVRSYSSQNSVSIFLYQFKNQKFYLSKCIDAPEFDPGLVGTNIAGQTLAAVVERALGFEIDPVTQKFKDEADATMFLLTYENYLVTP